MSDRQLVSPSIGWFSKKFPKIWTYPYLFNAACLADCVSGYRRTSTASSIHRQSLARWQQQAKRMVWKLSGRRNREFGTQNRVSCKIPLPILLPTYHLRPDSALKLAAPAGTDECVNQSREKKQERNLMIGSGKFHISHRKIRLNIDFYQFFNNSIMSWLEYSNFSLKITISEHC